MKQEDKIKPVEFYVCSYCDSVFDSKPMAELHVDECLHNYDDVRTCASCKFAEINLVAPTDNDNGYKSLRLQNMIGTKAYLTCKKGVYGGKMREDIILREDKDCWISSEGAKFHVIKTDGYKRYKRLLEEADEEQKIIDEDINEYWNRVRELDEQGLTLEEIEEQIKEDYKDYGREEEH